MQGFAPSLLEDQNSQWWDDDSPDEDTKEKEDEEWIEAVAAVSKTFPVGHREFCVLGLFQFDIWFSFYTRHRVDNHRSVISGSDAGTVREVQHQLHEHVHTHTHANSIQ